MFGKWDVFDVIKALFKMLITVLIIAVAAVLLWRVISSRVPKDLLAVSVNETLTKAYEKGDLSAFTQKQNSITRTDKNYGYFSVCDTVFFPEAGQVQILIRYNDSTLKALQKDYGLAELPDSSLDWYDVTLVVSTDLTPENPDDNNERTPSPEHVSLTRIEPTSVSESRHEGRYSYRRLVFDGADLSDILLGVYVDFYYVGDIAYLEPDFDIYSGGAYGTLCLYAYTENKIPLDVESMDLSK